MPKAEIIFPKPQVSAGTAHELSIRLFQSVDSHPVDRENAKDFIRRGADLLLTDQKGLNALHHAAFHNEDRIIYWMFVHEGCPSVDVRDPQLRTPLHHAALGLGMPGNPSETVEMLIEADADIDARDNQGRTPMMLAAQRGGLAFIDRLLLAGAKAKLEDHDGLTLLDHASCPQLKERIAKRLKRLAEWRAESILSGDMSVTSGIKAVGKIKLQPR